MTKIEKTVEEIHAKAQELLEHGKRLEKEAKELEAKVRLARGTVHPQAPKTANKVIKQATEYFVGDEGPTPALLETVERLLRERPLTFQELLDATGARENRIKGVIVRLQRAEHPVVNLGNDRRALWFIPDQALLTRLMRVKRS